MRRKHNKLRHMQLSFRTNYKLKLQEVQHMAGKQMALGRLRSYELFRDCQKLWRR